MIINILLAITILAIATAYVLWRIKYFNRVETILVILCSTIPLLNVVTFITSATVLGIKYLESNTRLTKWLKEYHE